MYLAQEEVLNMKRFTTVLICGLLAALVAAVPATAYTIDGDLSDWGLAKLNTDDWSVEGTWIPNWHVTYIVEDNYNPLHGILPSGVHIKGIGDSYTFYDEEKLVLKATGTLVSEPWGGENYDLEALYFDQDSSNIYLAVVTSLDPNGQGDKRPGDIALNIDGSLATGDLGYEYGIKISPIYPGQGDIISMPEWEKIGYLLPVKPDIIKTGTGTKVGEVQMAAFFPLAMNDNGYPNYVIEMAIPKDILGVDGQQVSFAAVMTVDNCINEHIYVPEFPTVAVSLAVIIGLVFAVFVMRERDE